MTKKEPFVAPARGFAFIRNLVRTIPAEALASLRFCGHFMATMAQRDNSIGRSGGLRLDISAMSETAAPPSTAAPIPSHAELFLAFFRITLSGFGGTLPWTRRMFVERKRWMTAEEFNEAYALCQFLPGPISST